MRRIERPPFVSGLAGRDVPAPQVVDTAGLAVLQSIKLWAQATAADDRPRTHARFDGTERYEAAPDAIATVEACDAIVRLVDGLLGDALLARRAALLVRERVR